MNEYNKVLILFKYLYCYTPYYMLYYYIKTFYANIKLYNYL